MNDAAKTSGTFSARTFACLLGLLLLAMPIQGQAPREEEPLPPEARQRLDYAIGDWVSRTEGLNQRGEVVRTSFSEDQRRFVIENRVVEITGVMRESGKTFRAWEYYDERAGRYSLTSINREGQLMTMSGELGGEFQWASEPQERPNGDTFILRFTHYDIEPDSFKALGEYSRDGGETWTPFSRQHLTRQTEGASE